MKHQRKLPRKEMLASMTREREARERMVNIKKVIDDYHHYREEEEKLMGMLASYDGCNATLSIPELNVLIDDARKQIVSLDTYVASLYQEGI